MVSKENKVFAMFIFLVSVDLASFGVDFDIDFDVVDLRLFYNTD